MRIYGFLKRHVSFLLTVIAASFILFQSYRFFRPIYQMLDKYDKVWLIIVLLSVFLKAATDIAIFWVGRYLERNYTKGARKRPCRYRIELKDCSFQCEMPFYSEYRFHADGNICHAELCAGYRPADFDGETLVRSFSFVSFWKISLDFVNSAATIVLVIRTLMGVA